MIFQVLEYWEGAIDGIQIILCLLILLFLIRIRSKQNQLFVKRKKNGYGPDFNIEVYNQTIKQHVEHAFSNIIGTISAEKCSLERTLQVGPIKAEKLPISEVQPLPWMFNSQESTRVYSDIMAEDDRYLQIKELTTQGMSVQQISEKLKIPKGEVDLILSVQKGGNCFLEDGHF